MSVIAERPIDEIHLGRGGGEEGSLHRSEGIPEVYGGCLRIIDWIFWIVVLVGIVVLFLRKRYDYARQFQKELEHSIESSKNIFGLEKGFQSLIAFLQNYSITQLVRSWASEKPLDKQKIIDWFCSIKLVALFCLCVISSSFVQNQYISIFIQVSVYCVLLDLMLHFWGLIFHAKFVALPSVSLERSLLLSCMNYMEIIFGFSALYLYSNALSESSGKVVDWLSAIYYSVVTGATMGDGVITPNSVYARVLVIFQVLVTFTFVVLVLSDFVARKSNDQRAKGVCE